MLAWNYDPEEIEDAQPHLMNVPKINVPAFAHSFVSALLYNINIYANSPRLSASLHVHVKYTDRISRSPVQVTKSSR